MKMIMLSILLLATVGTLSGAPVVSNLTVAQRSDNTKMVDVWFDLTNSLPMTVTLLVSDDNGVSWDVSCNLTSGDIGLGISPGSGKHIVWDVLAEHPGINGDQFKFKIIADDGTPPPVPEGFVLVEGGTFNNGTGNVTLTSYYLARYELKQSEYLSVMGVNPSTFTGIPDRPVETVMWFDAIEYCNRRSILEGLVPCYQYLGYGTNPDNWPANWNSTYSNHYNVYCTWTADGYRLPTEMQWMFAARGGNLTHGYTYSGGNDINAVAWYAGNSGMTTHSVGLKEPNELGLYDMSGNVYEWCWDIYGNYFPFAQTDPTGANTGTYQVIRGGAWYENATMCRVVTRGYSYADQESSSLGFRLCRRLP